VSILFIVGSTLAHSIQVNVERPPSSTNVTLNFGAGSKELLVDGEMQGVIEFGQALLFDRSFSRKDVTTLLLTTSPSSARTSP
jgi:hypothetical protein